MDISSLTSGHPGCGRRRRFRKDLRRCTIGAVMLLFSSALYAQTGDRDYYSANLTQEGTQLLRNVEQYHIGPVLSKMAEKQYMSAKGDIEFILGFFPNHPRGLMLLSDLCDQKWKGPGCNPEPWFEKAIARNPAASTTFLVYGVHLQRRNMLPGAIENLKRALELDPGSANAHYNLGLAYFEQKQYDLANRHAQASYELGIPLPGLKDKLTRGGYWKRIDADALKKLIEAQGDTAGSAKPDAPKSP